MFTFLTTERLILREFALEDASFIMQLLNTDGWLKYIGDRDIKTEADARTYLTKIINGYAASGFGFYLVALRNDQTPIGMSGLIKRDYMDCADIGFAYLPDYEGRGYAYEAAMETLRFAQEGLRHTAVAAITVSYNARSIALIEKLGLAYHKTIRPPDDTEDVRVYYTSF